MGTVLSDSENWINSEINIYSKLQSNIIRTMGGLEINKSQDLYFFSIHLTMVNAYKIRERERERERGERERERY